MEKREKLHNWQCRTELHRILDAYFDESELRLLCFELEVEYENLQGKTRAGKAMSLIVYLERRGYTPEHLIDRCRQMRSNIDWDSILEATQEPSPVSRGLSSDLVKKHFVDREQQIILFRGALNHIRSGKSVFKTILEFTGIPTIGKTTLVSLLCEVCKDKGVHYAHIDFDPNVNQNAREYLESSAQLLIDIAMQLDILKRLSPYDAAQKYDKPALAVSEQARQETLLVLTQTLRQEVNKLLQEDPVVLFFDTADQAHPAILSFLEEEVVCPLAHKGRCLFVFAGRGAIIWRQFAVRQRVRTEHLTAFEIESVEDQLRQDARYSYLAHFSAQIHDLTGGLPLGNLIASRRMSELVDAGHRLEPRALFDDEPALIESIVKEVIDEQILRGIDPLLVEAYHVLALVRRFDVNLMRRLLPGFVSAPDNDYTRLRSALAANHLILSDGKGCYNTDVTLQHILGRWGRLQSQERYCRVNHAAMEIYQEWIERVAEDRSIYVVEALYHEACLALVEREEDFSGLQESLGRYLGYYQHDDPDILDSMIDRLEKELGNDLAWDGFGGLGEILPRTVAEALQEQVAVRREEMQQLLGW